MFDFREAGSLNDWVSQSATKTIWKSWNGQNVKGDVTVHSQRTKAVLVLEKCFVDERMSMEWNWMLSFDQLVAK